MKRVLVILALLAISAIYLLQSNDQEKVKIGSSASPEKLTQRDYQDSPKKIILLIGDGMGPTDQKRFNFRKTQFFFNLSYQVFY